MWLFSQVQEKLRGRHLSPDEEAIEAYGAKFAKHTRLKIFCPIKIYLKLYGIVVLGNPF